jgi:DNA gyrase/topoisomerase IV subunit A
MNNIERIEAGEHVLQSYMPYAVSTIVDRALPDVRDGLKPVHRRILSQMKKGKMVFENERSKTMDSISQTMRIHHHGDSSILDAIALMTEQNESLLHPFIDGEGAFGKVYSKDKPTPPRYTYCRLNEFAEELFKDVSNGIITMIGEDKDHLQPLTLSADFPNILIKNNKGIACGEACDFPSFNLSEVCDATVSYIDNKDIDLFDYIKGVDFPTGAYMIFNKTQLDQFAQLLFYQCHEPEH